MYFSYKKFSNKILASFLSIFLGISSLIFPYFVSASSYVETGLLTSANLLPISGASMINSVELVTIIPANAGLGVEFSYDMQSWYGANGVLDTWTNLTTGTNTFDLSALGWKKPYFYYRVWFYADGNVTPVLDSASVSFTSFDGTFYVYSTNGTLLSSNLLPSDGVGAINSFGYTVSSVPPSTGMTISFSQDNSSWYNSLGVLNGSDTLSVGTHSINLSSLGWSGGSFYYKVIFVSDGTATPILDAINLNYNSNNYYWVGNDVNNNWNNSNNWAYSQGATGGFGVPGADDTAIFDSGDVTNAVIDSNVSVKNLKINSGYTGTISLLTHTLSISDNLIQNAGIFNGGSGTITVGNDFSLLGGAFTSTSGNFNISGDWIHSAGNFSHNGGSVKFVGQDQTISGSNSFYNFSKIDSTNNSTDEVLTFDNAGTQTIAGLLEVKGIDDEDRVNLVSDVSGQYWSLVGDGTFSIDFAFVADSDASSGSLITFTNTEDGGHNLGWNFDILPPTTSDDYGAKDNIWQTSAQTITLTPADNISGVASTKYCIDTTNTCDPDSGTNYSTPVVISSEGISYFRYQSIDNIGNEQTIVSRTVKIDTLKPQISNITPTENSKISASQAVNFSLNESGDCRMSLGENAKSYDDMINDVSCTVSNSVQISCIIPSLGSSGQKDFYLACRDYLGNKDTSATATHISYIKESTQSGSSVPVATLPAVSPVDYFYYFSINDNANTSNNRQVTLNFSVTPGWQPQSIVVSFDPDFIDAFIIPYQDFYTLDICQNKTTCKDGYYTIYAKYMNASGLTSSTVSDSIRLNAIPLTEEIAEKIKEKVNNIIPKLEEKIKLPEVDSSFSKNIPDSLKNIWDVVPSSVNNFIFADLPEDFQFIVNKFPGVSSTLKKVGVEKMVDADQMTVARISLPSLSEIASLSKEQIINLSGLSQEEANKIPTDIIFAQTAQGSMDLNSNLTISNKGLAVQTLNTVQGQSLRFTIKPEETAEKVLGYFIFKSSKTNSPLSRENVKATSLTASAFQGSMNAESVVEDEKVSAETNIESTEEPDLVLAKFEYKDSGNGIWTADVASPLVLGQYELRTVVNFKEKKSRAEVSMIIIVDPEGYVYEKNNDGKEIRIDNAIVSIYWLNPETKEYELWPAKEYRQQNPQTTDVTGRYAFLVPPGDYYLTATADNYHEFKSDSFKVEENKGVFINIELKPSFSLSKIFNVTNILLALIFCAIVGLAFIIGRKKFNNVINK